MRDDLHRGSKMLRHWTRVIRVVSRDADWRSAGAEAIEHALMREVREVLSDEGVRKFMDATLDTQVPMFAPVELLRAASQHRLVELMADYVGLHANEGLRGRDLVLASLGDALREDLAAKRREMVAHVHSVDEPSAAEIAQRFEVASKGAEARSLAFALRESAAGARSKPSLDMDANLLGGL